MARMMKLRQFSRNGKKSAAVRRASWPTGMRMELAPNERGAMSREAVVVYPAGSLGPEETRQRMPIDPEEEHDDWEDYVEE